MPTKVFDQLDTTSSIHASGGHLTYNTPTNGATIDFDMADMISLAAPLSFDVSFNLAAQGTTVSIGVQGIAQHNWSSALHLNTVTMDYQKPITGIPDGAMIKSMVIRSPWNCNLNLSYSKTGGTYQAGSTKSMKVRRSINIPAFFLESRAFGRVTDPNQSLQLVDEEVNADADVEIFNILDPLDYIPVADFVANYSTIILRIDQSDAIDLHTAQLLAGSAASDTITASLIYLVSFHTGWTITVEYEEAAAFNFLVSQENAPVDVGTEVTVTSDPEIVDPPPLDLEEIETIEIEFEDPDNPGFFLTFPVLVFTPLTPFLLTFLIPSWGSYTPPIITVYITSTEFSGRISIGRLLTIYFNNAPGIYRLIPGQVYDTFYTRSLEDPPEVTTIDVKIPNPKIRTGFF